LCCPNSNGGWRRLLQPRWIALAAVQIVLLWSIPKTGAELPQLRSMVDCHRAPDARITSSRTEEPGLHRRCNPGQGRPDDGQRAGLAKALVRRAHHNVRRA
jgi:hypothetical protein